MEIATFIVSIISLVIMPLILIGLNLKTSKDLEENKIRTDYKVQTYKNLFEIFNSVLTKTNSETFNVKSRIDLVTDLIKYAPDEIVKKYLVFWDKVKIGEKERADLNCIYQDILLLIRKDLGNHKTKLTKEEITRMLLSDKS